MSKWMIVIVVMVWISGAIVAQVSEDIFFLEKPVAELEKEIYKATRKHALYSYNIANATTPGFEPILYPEDEAELKRIMALNNGFSEKVLLEHMTSLMAKNRNIQASYLTLYKKRFDTYRQIVTAGKK
jgi:hypothetical protein